MTSIRSRLELHGTLDSKTRHNLLKNIGSVPPPCCVHFFKGKFQCDRTEEPLSYKEFRDFCLACQAEMLYKIGGFEE